MPDAARHRARIEPWLSSLLQAEHLNLLVGSGFTTAVANEAGSASVDLAPTSFSEPYVDCVDAAAKSSAQRMGRCSPNFEDQVRAVMDLIAGLRVVACGPDADDRKDRPRLSAAYLLEKWTTALDTALSSVLEGILNAERGIDEALLGRTDDHPAENLRRLLGGFLLPFAARTATRERTHIFTTNYDRLIEYSCDLLGLRVLDRFVGSLAPVFRSSRLGVDLHYNPPGIRGEPRYIEGVVRLTKLHGSIDWRSAAGPSGGHEVQRVALPFGAASDHTELPACSSDRLLIYPNSAKDVETLLFPYADLFRDFAAAVCQPNAVLVTYGFGFGDDHVNRILRDALSIPSTHIVIISYDDAGGRLQTFLSSVGRKEQVTLLRGSHFGDLSTLVEHYLPKHAIDRATWRMVELLNRRTPVNPALHGPESDRVPDQRKTGASE